MAVTYDEAMKAKILKQVRWVVSHSWVLSWR